MYTYQKNNQYFAQIADGIDDLVEAELAGLGAQNIRPGVRGVFFSANPETLYAINYGSRLCTRVLAPLTSFDCHTSEELYAGARNIKWTDFFSTAQTFAIFANVSKSTINHSQYAGLVVKDAIVDWYRDKFGRRPNVDSKTPDVWLNLHLLENHATISLDTSGSSLHRRGYRTATLKAPMKETVAAAAIKLSGWDGSQPLYDPMCGSGTILIEAMMQYCRIPAGFFRKRFGFEALADYDRDLWARTKARIDSGIRALPEGLIGGSDITPGAVAAARVNCRKFKSGDRIELNLSDYRRLGEIQNKVIITNPPYGIRMGNAREMDRFYKNLGDFLKKQCKGSTAYVYFGDRVLIKQMGLKASWKRPLQTGGLDGRLVKYEMY
ncbi:MAG: class I SAM-dependent RNA methyltransferase [Desulfobacteraceae bacterium]|nr:class I SAM-dependent RNA methyltransferase [Desulfobacteraceae bacterium]